MRGLAAAVLAFALVWGAGAADASHPGRNGLIALELGDSAVFTIGPDGSGLRRRIRVGQSPAWSPDGSALAYEAAKHGDAGPIMVSSPTGRHARRVAPFGRSPAWSPDGSRIAYAYGYADLVIVTTAGRRLRRFRLSELYQIHTPEWSPDGRFIVLGASETHAYCCLYVANADGSGLRPLVREQSGRQAVRPHWSPDGRTIAFTTIENCRASACSGPHAASTIGADGRDRRVVRAGAFALSWSPDGRYLLLSQHSGGLRLERYAVGDGAVKTLSEIEPWDTTFAGGDWQPRCTVSGTQRADKLRARRDLDLVCGRGGADRLIGGPGRDHLLGGAGNDAFLVRRGGLDVVGCGPGRDAVAADPDDVVGVDCERIERG
jgi:Tol biopolymer transport system component